MLHERSQICTIRTMWFHLYDTSRKSKSVETEGKISGCLGLGAGWDLLLIGTTDLLGGDGIVLKLDYGDSGTTLKINWRKKTKKNSQREKTDASSTFLAKKTPQWPLAGVSGINCPLLPAQPLRRPAKAAVFWESGKCHILFLILISKLTTTVVAT